MRIIHGAGNTAPCTLLARYTANQLRIKEITTECPITSCPYHTGGEYSRCNRECTKDYDERGRSGEW